MDGRFDVSDTGTYYCDTITGIWRDMCQWEWSSVHYNRRIYFFHLIWRLLSLGFKSIILTSMIKSCIMYNYWLKKIVGGTYVERNLYLSVPALQSPSVFDLTGRSSSTVRDDFCTIKRLHVRSCAFVFLVLISVAADCISVKEPLLFLLLSPVWLVSTLEIQSFLPWSVYKEILLNLRNGPTRRLVLMLVSGAFIRFSFASFKFPPLPFCLIRWCYWI